MRKKWARIISGVTIFTLLTVSLTACKQKADQAATQDGAEIPVKYPIATQENPITIKVWADFNASTSKFVANYGETTPFKELEKATGIKVQWVHPPASLQKDTFNLLIASGDLPDAIEYPWSESYYTPGGPGRYANDDIIIKLNDYLKYAPNFSRELEDNEVKKSVTDDDGNIYYFPGIRKEEVLRTYAGYFIRQDWLDKVGAKMPTTAEELYNVLKLFQEKDANGNGKKDECWSTTKMRANSRDVDRLLWMFGTTYNFAVENGKVVFGPLTPQFKEAVGFVNKLYKEGLLDPEYLMNDTTQWETKYINEQAGAGYTLASSTSKFQLAVGKKNPNANFVAMPNIKTSSGQSITFDTNRVTIADGALALAITTANKHIPETVMWQDYIYGDKGSMIFNYGKEGETYNMVNGKPVFTDYIKKNPDGRPQPDMMAFNTGLTFWPMKYDASNFQEMKSPKEYEVIQDWTNSKVDTSKIVPKALCFNDEEQSLIQTKQTEINTYVAEMLDKYIVGKESMADYDKVFTERLKQLGIDDIVKVYNDAYARYLKK